MSFVKKFLKTFEDPEWTRDKRGNKIHRTAIIGHDVEIGHSNIIGPYCVIQRAQIGDQNTFQSHVAIGAPPEMRDFDDGDMVIIGHQNYFREFVTVHRGTGGPTYIGDINHLFVHSHVAHDVWIGDNNIISGAAMLGGHVRIMNHVNLGGNSLIHQRVVIGSFSMIGQGCNVTRHVEPGTKLAGAPMAYLGKNDWMIKKLNIGSGDLEKETAEWESQKESSQHQL